MNVVIYLLNPTVSVIKWFIIWSIQYFRTDVSKVANNSIFFKYLVFFCTSYNFKALHSSSLTFLAFVNLPNATTGISFFYVAFACVWRWQRALLNFIQNWKLFFQIKRRSNLTSLTDTVYFSVPTARHSVSLIRFTKNRLNEAFMYWRCATLLVAVFFRFARCAKISKIKMVRSLLFQS